MARTNSVQFNVRSAFARARDHALAQQTGMSATQVVEEALRCHVPAGGGQKVGRLMRKGSILMRPSDGAAVAFAEAETALDAAREHGFDLACRAHEEPVSKVDHLTPKDFIPAYRSRSKSHSSGE